MKIQFLIFFFCLFSIGISGQDPCQLSLFSPIRDNPPGCLLCETLLEVSTGGYSKDTFQYDFPCGVPPTQTQWFSIFPDIEKKIMLIILTQNCSSGDGVQGAIYDQNFNLVSNCYSDDGSNLGVLTASNLNPWQYYYLMVDGKNGSNCEFMAGISIDTQTRTLDTMLCPGSCVMVGDSCYYKSQAAAFTDVCSTPIPLNIHHPDTSDFEIKWIIDSFTNLLSFDWNVVGADSFDLFIDDVFIRTQAASFYSIPLSSANNLLKIKVVPHNMEGCSFKTSELEVQILDISSTSSQNKLEKLISVAPNPSKNIFRISSQIQILEIDVYDLNGKKIMNSKSDTLDLSPFGNGIYFFKIRTDLGVILKRVLKI